jgi:hypothetical protein
MNTINDPSNYRKMSEPFANSEAANAALEAFFVEVGPCQCSRCEFP